MKEITKSIGEELRRILAPVVERPMSWPIIDALEGINDVAQIQEAPGADGLNAPPLPPRLQIGSRAPPASSGLRPD